MRKLAFLLLALSFGISSKAQTNTARMLSGITAAPVDAGYTFVCTDVTKLVVFNNSTPQTASLFAATDPCSGVGVIFSVKNNGTAPVAITPVSGLIDGAGSLSLAAGQGSDIYNDGTNYTSQGGGVGAAFPFPRLDQVLDPNVSKTFNLGVPSPSTLAFINGNVDLTGTNLAIPNSAGCTATATAQICLDTTLLNIHLWNTANNVVALFPVSSSFTDGDVLGISINAGKQTIQDLGPVNAASGRSFLMQNNTSLLDGDLHCWDSTAVSNLDSWPNCTPGAADGSISGATSTYTIGFPTDQLTTIDHDTLASSAVTITLPTADNLGLNPGFVFVYSNHSAFIDDILPTTWTINSAPDLQVNPNTFCRVRVDPFLATNWIADCSALGTPAVTFTSNGLISGGGVVWTGLLHFTVAPAVYGIAGTQYTSPQTNLTLSAADPTNPRIDVIAVNTSGAAVVITGTPAASPAAPSVDPTSQLSLTFVTVAATATVPTLTNITVYDENLTPPTEWTCSSTAAFNCNSTNNPFHLTKDIEVTAAVSGGQVTLTNSAPVSLSTFSTLSFNIRNKAAWAGTTSVSICFLNGATIVGSCVAFKNGAYGFNQTNITGYQLIVIPLSNFSLTGNVDRVRFQVVSNSGSIGFYLDWIQIQSSLGGSGNGSTGLQLQVNGANTQQTATLTNNGSVTFAQTVANGVSTITATAVGAPPSGAAGGDLTGTYPNPTLVAQYKKLRCETGLGDGLNAMAAGTYLQSFCYNDSGVTWTITGIKCFTDNSGTSTLNAAGNTLGALLTGAVTCTSSFAAGTQSANVALTSGDYIKFTFVADGTSKQTTWVVSMTQ